MTLLTKSKFKNLFILPKDLFQSSSPVIKNLTDFFSYKKLIGYGTQKAHWWLISNQVRHQNTSFNRFYTVFMMPDFIGSCPLFVHKINLLFYMCYLCYPVRFNIKQG